MKVKRVVPTAMTKHMHTHKQKERDTMHCACTLYEHNFTTSFVYHYAALVDLTGVVFGF